jgi:hypothetical protein
LSLNGEENNSAGKEAGLSNREKVSELSSCAGKEGSEFGGDVLEPSWMDEPEGVPAASLYKESSVGLVPDDAVVAPSNGPNSSAFGSESQAGECEYARKGMRMGDPHMGGMARSSELISSSCSLWESGEASPMETSSSSPSLEAMSTVLAPSVSSSSSDDWPGDAFGSGWGPHTWGTMSSEGVWESR